MFKKGRITKKPRGPRPRCGKCKNFVKSTISCIDYVTAPTRVGWWCFTCNKFYYNDDWLDESQK